MVPVITVVGGGFAGVEAAWAAAQRGAKVRLIEMRPTQTTPAHTTDLLCELVCSNSLKSRSPTSPAGQLKAEMVGLGSLVIPTAEKHAVPGGEALAIDRSAFAREVTAKVQAHPNIEVIRKECTPEGVEEARAGGPVILATGPLTSPALAEWLGSRTGREHLYFYDAVSPTVEASTIDTNVAFAQSRYDKGGDDYLNCPFDKEEYEAFVRELVAAERAPLHDFEEAKYFAGCMPIEEIARKGERSLAFGNFKPVGLTDPRTGRRPYAALQLRPENRDKSLYSLVACQTRLKWGDQRRVLRMVPGLKEAEFVRLGVIHRNTYIDAPRVLQPWLELRDTADVFVAGQLTGVEGYVESAAMGILAGVTSSRGEHVVPPRETALGSLVAHLQDDTPREFAPMNVNWGMLPDPPTPMRDKGATRAAKLEAAAAAFEAWRHSLS